MRHPTAAERRQDPHIGSVWRHGIARRGQSLRVELAHGSLACSARAWRQWLSGRRANAFFSSAACLIRYADQTQWTHGETNTLALVSFVSFVLIQRRYTESKTAVASAVPLNDSEGTW
jgi:hypothetical protein